MSNTGHEELNVLNRSTKVGGDIGNNSMKLVLDGEHFFEYKSIAKERNDDKRYFNTLELVKQYGDDLIDKFDVKIKLNGSKIARGFVIGQESMAERTGNIKEREADRTKYNDQSLASWFIAAIAHSYVRNMSKEELEGIDVIKLDVKACVGLPYSEMTGGEPGENKEIFTNLIKGTHTVEFMIKECYPVDKVIVEVSELFVDTEGVSALRFLTNENKVLADATLNLENNIVGLVDIGAGTREHVFATYVRDEKGNLKLKHLPVVSYGENYSIGNVYSEVATDVTSRIADGVTHIIKNELEEAYFNGGRLKGQLEDIYEIAESVDVKLYGLGERIGSGVVDCIISNKYRPDNLQLLYIVGGGANSELLTDSVKEVLERNKFKTKVVVVTDKLGTFTNVLGYYKVLIHKLKSVGK